MCRTYPTLFKSEIQPTIIRTGVTYTRNQNQTRCVKNGPYIVFKWMVGSDYCDDGTQKRPVCPLCCLCPLYRLLFEGRYRNATAVYYVDVLIRHALILKNPMNQFMISRRARRNTRVQRCKCKKKLANAKKKTIYYGKHNKIQGQTKECVCENRDAKLKRLRVSAPYNSWFGTNK